MSIIDLTGEIYNGMWGYEPPFPTLNIKPLPRVPWVKTTVCCEIFDGFHSQTGTYLETPAHFFGDKSYPLIDVPIDKLCDIPCKIIRLEGFSPDTPNAPITRNTLLSSPAFSEIEKGDAVLISCDYGKYWNDACYLSSSPYFTADAMALLIGKKPFLLGSDFPRWDSLPTSQGFWNDFYSANILLLAPLIIDSAAPAVGGELTVLPIKAVKTSCAPCRAILKF